MSYKSIERSREARLWIGQIIMPTITMVGSVLAIPELRDAIACKAKAVKETIKNKAKKGSR